MEMFPTPTLMRIQPRRLSYPTARNPIQTVAQMVNLPLTGRELASESDSGGGNTYVCRGDSTPQAGVTPTYTVQLIHSTAHAVPDPNGSPSIQCHLFLRHHPLFLA
jgi:hypothetical protein